MSTHSCSLDPAPLCRPGLGTVLLPQPVAPSTHVPEVAGFWGQSHRPSMALSDEPALILAWAHPGPAFWNYMPIKVLISISNSRVKFNWHDTLSYFNAKQILKAKCFSMSCQILLGVKKCDLGGRKSPEGGWWQPREEHWPAPS